MITEDYVNFETAKLLKEKGFDEYCCQVYAQHPCHDEPIIMLTDATTNSKGVFGSVFYSYASAPTLQMAMKWLREVQQISVEAHPDWFDSNHTNIHDGWYCEVRYLTNMSYAADCFERKKYDSYEKAGEAAIKYCLENLI